MTGQLGLKNIPIHCFVRDDCPTETTEHVLCLEEKCFTLFASIEVDVSVHHASLEVCVAINMIISNNHKPFYQAHNLTVPFSIQVSTRFFKKKEC